jgi:exopolysaccharide biosynthesis polyprenyl glycosylphosphotransferase
VKISQLVYLEGKTESTSLEVPVFHEKRIFIINKRIADILLSVFGILILLPLLILISLAIKIEDPRGTIFFKQKRIGENGKEFEMYKFRSMVTNADKILDSLMHRNETTGPMFKLKDDPRVTKMGKFIRKTSIDELPQLWNVIMGEMSLVGPRPPLPREVKDYTEYARQRLLVTPGCTGLWQVSGRSNIGFDEMVELDLLYIENRSIFLDIKIILKTFAVIVNSKGAY